MTRETKLGLVVGISFLSLVGVVGYTQWRKSDQPAPPPETPQPTVAQNNKPKDAPKPGAPSSPMQPAFGPDHGSAPAFPDFPQIPQVPGGPPTIPGQPTQIPGQPGTMPGLPPPPSSSSPPQFNIPAPGGSTVPGDKPGTSVPPIMPSQPGSFPGIPNNNYNSSIVGGGAPTPPTAPKSGFDIPPLPGQPQSNAATQPGTAGGPAPLPGGPTNPLNNSGPAGFSNPPNTNPQFPQIPAPGAPGAVPPGNNIPNFGNDKPSAPPNGFGTIPDPKQQAPLPGSPGGAIPIDIKPATPPGTAPQISTQGGLPNGNIPAPAGAPASGGGVTNQSYNERSYVCQAGDNDFAAISKRFFNGSDKYDKALIQYNREHPNGRDAVAFAPSLRQGTLVYIPPLPVLESKYSNLIPNFRPLTTDNQKAPVGGAIPPPAMVPVAPNTTPGAPAPIGGAPAPTAPSAPGTWGSPPNPTGQPTSPTTPGTSGGVIPAGNWTGTNTTSTGDYKLYRVSQPGKRLSEIAQDTLGNPNRWSEIIRLNPQVRQDEPVPVGTQLWLPPDARVGN